MYRQFIKVLNHSSVKYVKAAMLGKPKWMRTFELFMKRLNPTNVLSKIVTLLLTQWETYHLFCKEWINIHSWVMTEPSGIPEMAYCKVFCKSLPAKKLKLDLHQMPIRHEKINQRTLWIRKLRLNLKKE